MKQIPIEQFVLKAASKECLTSFTEDLLSFTSINEGWFNVIMNFLNNHSNNSFSDLDVEEIINFEKEDAEENFGIILDESVKDKVIRTFKLMTKQNIPPLKYKKILSQYQESLVYKYISYVNPSSLVAIEPEIHYKRDKVFKRRKYKRSKCDVVCINNILEYFYAYECKLTMTTFYASLNSQQLTNKKTRQVKRKQNYMAGLIKFFSNKTSAKSVKVAYMTFFETEDLISNIGIVPVISFRDIPYKAMV